MYVEGRKKTTISLTEKQLLRYKSQLALPGMSHHAQERLLKSTVIILGMAGSGPVAASNLIEAGIGRLILVDGDKTLLDAFKKQISGSCHDTEIECKLTDFEPDNVEELVKKADVIIDGLQNWQTKLLVSDVCMHMGRPFIHAGGTGYWFQIFTMIPAKSACLRCVFPQVGIDDVPLSPPRSGRLAPVVVVAGAFQALEAIKLIARLGATRGNELFKFDCLTNEYETIHGLDPKQDCPDCGRLFRNTT